MIKHVAMKATEINLILCEMEAGEITRLEALDKLCDLSIVSNWVAYDWSDIDSRPPKYGKYFVHRKDGKVHWETWNGSGWAYNEKVITHWKEVKPPCC